MDTYWGLTHPSVEIDRAGACGAADAQGAAARLQRRRRRGGGSGGGVHDVAAAGHGAGRGGHRHGGGGRPQGGGGGRARLRAGWVRPGEARGGLLDLPGPAGRPAGARSSSTPSVLRVGTLSGGGVSVRDRRAP
eukprot:6163642-Pyramimonas_sp.AAC.1